VFGHSLVYRSENSHYDEIGRFIGVDVNLAESMMEFGKSYDVIWFIALFYFGKPPKLYDDKLGM
jgi:hypothetical protein